MYLEAFKNWPEACQTEMFRPRLSITTLLPDQKRALWQHLKAFHPSKASEISMLMEDRIFSELLATFNADVLLEEEYVPANLKWLVRK